MSTRDTTIELIDFLFISAATVGCLSVIKILEFKSSWAALAKLRKAKNISVSGLRQLLSCSTDKNQVVVVRGFVQAEPKRWFSLQPNTVESSAASGNIQGVALLETQANSVRHVWKGPSLGCNSYMTGVYTSLTKVPSFLLAERKGGDISSDCVKINLFGLKSDHLPLTTIFDRLSSLNATCFTLPLPVKSLLGHAYPFGLCLREKGLPLNFARNHPGLLEEKILPLGKEISVVGIGFFKDNNVEIKPCDELPFFLSDLTKDQMIAKLARKTNYSLLSAIFLGTVSVGAFVYALMVCCQHFDKKMQQRRQEQERRQVQEWREVQERRQVQERQKIIQQKMRNDVDEGIKALPEELTCVVCAVKRRGSVFVPCGHLVCCQTCAPRVVRSKQCPICRQHIHESIRTYT